LSNLPRMKFKPRYITTIALSAAATLLLVRCASKKDLAKEQGLDIIAAGATPKLISKQFAFTEGPAVDKSGNVFFTDQPNDKIWKYSTDGKLSVFLDKTSRSNGMYFDKKGNLISCADEQNQLVSIDPAGKVTVLVNDFKGKKLNGPNDVWVDPKGGMYFTDPYYQRDYWTRKKPDIQEENVYYLAPGKKEAVEIAKTFKKPNGIIGTPNANFIFISDIGASMVYKFAVNADGTLGPATIFAKENVDGMTMDNRGNIYMAGRGVTVYNPAGKKIAQIPIPEGWTSNVCFAGKKRDKLFITASKAVYILDMNVQGIK
jgi:gluconolactonase